MNISRWLCASVLIAAAPACAGVVYSTLNNSGTAISGFPTLTADDPTLSSISQPLTLARVRVFGGSLGASGTMKVSIRAGGPGVPFPSGGTFFGSGTAAFSLLPGVWSILEVPLPNVVVSTASLAVAFVYEGTATFAGGAGIGYNSGFASVGTNGPKAAANGFIEFTSPPFGVGLDFELVAAPTPGAAGVLLPTVLLAARRRR